MNKNHLKIGSFIKLRARVLVSFTTLPSLKSDQTSLDAVALVLEIFTSKSEITEWCFLCGTHCKNHQNQSHGYVKCFVDGGIGTLFYEDVIRWGKKV